MECLTQERFVLKLVEDSSVVIKQTVKSKVWACASKNQNALLFCIYFFIFCLLFVYAIKKGKWDDQNLEKGAGSSHCTVKEMIIS